MAILDINLMLQQLQEAGYLIVPDKRWTKDEYYNYVIHQFNIVFIVPHIRKDIEESRSLGVNKSRDLVTGRFKNYWKKS